MLALKKIERFVCRKLAERLLPDQEGALTLPGELRRVLARRYKKLDDYISEVELLKNAVQRLGQAAAATDDDDDIDPDILAARQAAAADKFGARLKKRWRRMTAIFDGVPRWLFLFLLAALPTLSVGGYLYREAHTNTIKIGNEERFRNEHGEPLMRLVYVKDWPSSMATAYLLAHLLRTELRAEVLFKPIASTELREAWAMLVDNKADVFLSAWEPSQAAFFNDPAAQKNLMHVGQITLGAHLGLIVPEWTSLNTLPELANAAAEFNGVIYAIDPDSRLNSLVHRAVEDYQLTAFTVEEKSEPVMLAALQQAMRAHRPIVVAGWTPHAMFGEYALKFLEDPQHIFGSTESINIIATKNFASNFNETCAFLNRVKLTLPQFCDLLYCTRDVQTLAETVKKWAEDHQALIKEWRGR